MSRKQKRDVRVLVIGAGMSGILSAIKLREAGLDDFVVYEKGESLGGTWRENTYPGIACDVPSHFYSYSFALNPEWSHRFSPGDEIQAYFEDVAKRYDVVSKVRFGLEVTEATFENGRWSITLDDGSTDVGDFIIAATGVLHRPNVPNFDGLDSFAGKAFHSARWDHSVDLADKRVGVVGTGSSAIQIVSALAGQVRELQLFQRTPQWVTPMENPSYSDEQRAEFRQHPESMESIRAEVSRAFTDGFANVLIDAESPVLQAIQASCVANLEDHVKDLELREKLRPNYRATCKRLVISENFYDAIQHPRSRLVTEGIDRIEPAGVRTEDGVLHELDVLVLATGFRVDSFVRPMNVVGRGGTALDEIWKEGPHAYLAISVRDVPNFFMINGPNSPVGNFSLIEVAELQVNYILQLIDAARSDGHREIAVSAAAMERFDQERREAAKGTIWATGCKSWYLDHEGLPTAWPWKFDRFREEMSAPRLADFEMQ